MKILIIDDETKLGFLLASALRKAGFEADFVDSAEKALRKLDEDYDVFLTDIRMPGMDGMEFLREVKARHPGATVVMMTAHGSVKSVVEAMKAGAYDYLLKPFSTEELIVLMRRLAEETQIRQELEYRRKTEQERFGELVGQSPAMRKIFELIERVAPSDATVLITGETGTGKELVAREIHRRSPRAEKPFVAINCAAITETLLESELFGYERGAFTGADRRKPGMFELANGGTLFLDEIAEMPPALQAKLLRVLQDRTVYHLGGTTPIPVDVRIIAATNKDLKHLVQEKKFREDLYFRLAVFPIHLPPLRERREDIPLLVENFFARRRITPEISPEAMELLKNYDYPGNVRELENILERALILSGGAKITPEHLPELEEIPAEDDTPPIPGETTLAELERKMLLAALEKAGGNKSKAARLLGITRRMLYTRLKKYGIE